MIILQAHVEDNGMSLFYPGSMGAWTVTGSSKTSLSYNVYQVFL